MSENKMAVINCEDSGSQLYQRLNSNVDLTIAIVSQMFH